MLATGLLAAGLGLIVGSFLNVCIHRVPRRESVVRPGSHCPSCGKAIRLSHNIPLLSYALLRGRCAHCYAPIGWSYPTVELLTAVLFVLLHLRFGWQSFFWVNALFAALLVALIFIDLFERLLPDALTLNGMMAGILLAPFQDPRLLHSSSLVESYWLNSYLNSLLGVVAGGGFLWLVAVLYLQLRRIEGLGFGDVKLMAMVGAFVGWQYTWITIFLGSVLGALLGGLFILLASRNHRYELPFGTFLGLAALLVVLYGPQFIRC